MKTLSVSAVLLASFYFSFYSSIQAQDSSAISWQKPIYARSLNFNGGMNMFNDVQFTSLRDDEKKLARFEWLTQVSLIYSDSGGYQRLMNFFFLADMNSQSKPYKIGNDWKDYQQSSFFLGLGGGMESVFYNGRYSISLAIGAWKQDDSAKNDAITFFAHRIAGSAEIAIYEGLGMSLQTNLMIGTRMGFKPSGTLMINQYLTKETGNRSVRLSAGITAQNLLLSTKIAGKSEYLWGPTIRLRTIQEGLALVAGIGYNPDMRSPFFSVSVGMSD